MRAESIAALRVSLEKARFDMAAVRIPLGHDAADLCLKGGLLRGALHEVFAAPGHEAAATGFAAGLAARVAAAKPMLWIRQDFSALEFGEISAMGLLELGIDPSRLLMLHVADAVDGLRAANDALSCAALGTVVIEIPGRPKALDLITSRRLTLACAQKAVTVFLLRFAAQPDASTAETRWLIRSAASPLGQDHWGYPAFETGLLRNRNGQTGQWVMGWNCDNGIFQNPTSYRGALVSAAADGPLAEARAKAG